MPGCLLPPLLLLLIPYKTAATALYIQSLSTLPAQKNAPPVPTQEFSVEKPHFLPIADSATQSIERVHLGGMP